MSKDNPTRALAGNDGGDDARYRTTFQQAAIGIALTTADGTFLDVNPALCAIFGYQRRDLMRLRLAELLLRSGELAGSRGGDDSLAKLLSGKVDSYSCIEHYRREKDAAVWVQRTVSLASNATGASYLVHFVEDITSRKRAQEQQRLTDLRYQRTLESALDCIVSTDHLGRIIEFNPMAEKVFGYTRSQVVGRRLSDVLVPPRLRSRHVASMERLLSGDQQSMLNRRIETIALKADGTAIPVELMMQRITDADPPLFTGFLRDISDRKKADARILRLNRLYRTLSHTSALIVRARDRDTLFKGICRIARLHGGFLMPWVGVIDPATATVRLGARAENDAFDIPQLSVDPRVPEGQGPVGTAVREARIVVCNDCLNDPSNALWRERFHRSGIRSLAVLPLRSAGQVAGVLVLNAGVAGYFNEDIQQLLREMVDELSHALDRLRLEQKHQEAEQQLAHLAHYEQLTGLPNRGLFYERLTHGIAQAARNAWTLGVIFIDLDRFKTVNDTMGHTTGDALLHQVATRLLECVRGADTVSRLSGDEFAIVLARLADAGDAGLVATKILSRLKQPYAIDDFTVVVSASIGITLYPQDGDNPDVLMRNADVAMYNAKSRGRDIHQFYSAEMNSRALEKLQLESRLRGALERSEFVLHYQPKVDIESGSICGFEALLRWQPAGAALVPPGEFIPLLEETGLITPVGEWVARAACAQIAAWRDAGCKLMPIAINLSARQLRHAGFREAVANALADHAVEARLIEVEITESSLMDNPEEAQKALRELKAVGVTLAIDDFGTGYSSLAYLKRFPFDTLKIDRSFVRDINTDPDDATIARTIIALGASLSLTVVAEGVETEEQLGFLVANRCDQAQGFLFSRPVPSVDATELLRTSALLHAPARGWGRAQTPAALVLAAGRDRLIAVQQLLQRDGYQVLTASRVADALEVLTNHNVVVAIADSGGEGSPEREFLRRVKAIEPRVVRVMLGASADSRMLASAVADGTAQKFFVAGRDDQPLREEVRKLLRRGSRPPAAVGAPTRKAVWGLKLPRPKRS